MHTRLSHIFDFLYSGSKIEFFLTPTFSEAHGGPKIPVGKFSCARAHIMPFFFSSQLFFFHQTKKKSVINLNIENSLLHWIIMNIFPLIFGCLGFVVWLIAVYQFSLEKQMVRIWTARAIIDQIFCYAHFIDSNFSRILLFSDRLNQ
jgi:hypothetical protein